MRVFDAWGTAVKEMQYEALRTAVEAHFTAKENIVSTRHRFFSMSQESGDTINIYLERIETLGRVCRFGNLEKELVLQVLIKGMKEEKLSKELLLKRQLDLAKARDICTQYEAAVVASDIITKPGLQLDTI